MNTPRFGKLILPFVFLLATLSVRALDQGADEKTGTIDNGLWQNGVPLGALGCGRFEILPSGWFSRFSINHNWDEPMWEHPWRPSSGSFFAVRAKDSADTKAAVRWLRFGFREHEFPGAEQVAHVTYRGKTPFIDATFEDPALPLGVSLHAWSSLIPQNVKDSSLPVAFFEFTLNNTNARPMEVSLLFSMEHLIGCGGYQVHGDHKQWREQDGNRTEIASVAGTPLTGLRFFSTRQFTGMKLNSSGEYLLLADGATTAADWDADSPAEFIKSFSTQGELSAIKPSTPNAKSPSGAICRRVNLPANSQQKLLFAFVWWMPHHVTMDGKDHGHFYQNEFKDPQSLVSYAFRERQRLEAGTMELRTILEKSNLPVWLQRMMLDSVATLPENSLLTRNVEFSMQEDPSWMEGALGTLDQRTVAHVFNGTFFPELSRSELSLFAQCQQPDGEMSHFLGNIYQTIGDPRVFYGITRWPDLSAVYIWQVLKHYRWTGDRDFLDRSWPGIKRALAWLVKTDTDGDGIPEGGTTYDAGISYAGGFVFTAGVYGAALQSAIAIAEIEKDTEFGNTCRQRLELLRTTMRQRLWTGQYFAKCYLPERNLVATTLFSAQLAGDWLTRTIGLPRVVTETEAQTSLESLLRVNGRNSPWPMIDEFTPDGKQHNDRCWFTYQETYFAGLAMSEGFVDDSMEIAWRCYEQIYHYLKTPWSVPINFMPLLTYAQGPNASYMSAPAAWWWLYQLTGSSADVSSGTLWLSPRLPSMLAEMHTPLFFPRVWLWLDYAPARNEFRVKVLRHFGDPVSFTSIGGDPNNPLVSLPAPFVAKEGETLDLSMWRDKLVTTKPRPALLDHHVLPTKREGLPTLAWTATVSDHESNHLPFEAYDGFLHTRWESTKPASTDMWWKLDLGRPTTFKTVEALTSPPEVVIDLSNDGKQWETMNPAAPQQQARYLRLRPATSTATKDPWRVFEIFVRP